MIVWGLALFVVATLLLAEAEDWFHRQNTSRAMLTWAEYLALPLGRAACVLLFLVSAYPAIFAVAGAPPLEKLVQGDHRTRLSDLLFVMFMLGLLLPLLPGIRRLPSLVLPLQTGIGVALMFRWLLEFLRRDVDLVPGPRQFTVLLLLWALGLALALAIAHLHAVRGGRRDLRHYLLAWLQLPVPVAYGLMLGASLRTA